MSGWRTLHAIVEDKDALPSTDEIEHFVSSRTSYPVRVDLFGDELRISVSGRDNDPLRAFAERYASALGTLALGRGNDNGPGPDSVSFYDTDGGTLTSAVSGDCPLGYGGLLVESTR